MRASIPLVLCAYAIGLLIVPAINTTRGANSHTEVADDTLKKAQERTLTARDSIRAAAKEARARHEREKRDLVDSREVMVARTKLQYVRLLLKAMRLKSRSLSSRLRKEWKAPVGEHEVVVTGAGLEYVSRSVKMQAAKNGGTEILTHFDPKYAPMNDGTVFRMTLDRRDGITDIENRFTRSVMDQQGRSVEVLSHTRGLHDEPIEEVLRRVDPHFEAGWIDIEIKAPKGIRKITIEVKRKTAEEYLTEAERTVKEVSWIPTQVLSRQEEELRAYGSLTRAVTKADAEIRKASVSTQDSGDTPGELMDEKDTCLQLADATARRVYKGLAELKKRYASIEQGGAVYVDVWKVTSKQMIEIEKALRKMDGVDGVRRGWRRSQGRFTIDTDISAEGFVGRLSRLKWPGFVLEVRQRKHSSILAVVRKGVVGTRVSHRQQRYK